MPEPYAQGILNMILTVCAGAHQENRLRQMLVQIDGPRSDKTR